MSRKTKLSQDRREKILSYMMATWEGKQESVRNTPCFSKLVENINILLREKYPEKDMSVLRKYKLTKQSSAILLHHGERIQGLEYHLFLDSDFKDIPTNATYRLPLVVDTQTMKIHDQLMKEYEQYKTTRKNKMDEFRGFIWSCNYVEDVMQYVDLPLSLQPVKGTAMVAVNPEVLNSIKKEFKNV